VLQDILQKRLCCAAPRFPIFLTRKASQENITGTIVRTARGEKLLSLPNRASEEQLSRAKQLFLSKVPAVAARIAALLAAARKAERDNAKTLRTPRNRREVRGNLSASGSPEGQRAKVMVEGG